MTPVQKVIKYLAIALAVFFTVSIIGGILGAVGLFGELFFAEDEFTEDMQTYSVSENVKSLDIEIKAASVYIKKGETFSVESNLKDLKTDEKNGCLNIKDTTEIKGRLFGSNTYEDAILTIYVPDGTVFEKVELITGAGRLTVDELSAAKLDFKLGAGEVSIEELNAESSAKIEGGAGKITVSGGAINDLDLEMGVGQFDLTSVLTGNCQLNSGVGETNIRLIGDRNDYKLELEKGLGNISVDGKDVSDYGSNGNGNNKVEIHGGIGSINVEFIDR